MHPCPLERPRGETATLALFCSHFSLEADRLRRGHDNGAALEAVAGAFAEIPYENLTKMIAGAAAGAETAKRLPHEVISQYVAQGSGGTCFSLTAALLHIVRCLGWRAEPILADRHYGENTHCALIVWVDGVPHLLDPGYLIVKPISLDRREETRVRTSFNEVILSPRSGGERIELHTLQHGNRSHRLTFKAGPADPAEFLKAWDVSFGWDMMRYPVLTRVVAGKHVYLQGQRLQVRGPASLERHEVALEDLPRRVAREFGVDVQIVERALRLLERQGELHGGTTGP